MIADAINRARQLLALGGACGPQAPVSLVATDAASIPAPLRTLLTATGGMTEALSRHWQSPISARPITVTADDRAMTRLVVLHAGRESRPVEVAVIRVRLRSLPQHIHAEIAAGSTPFGAVLSREGIAFQSQARAFFTLSADASMAAWAEVPPATPLFGRMAQLVDPARHLLAEAVEILPRV